MFAVHPTTEVPIITIPAKAPIYFDYNAGPSLAETPLSSPGSLLCAKSHPIPYGVWTTVEERGIVDKDSNVLDILILLEV